jgi:hypothetical protein
MRHSVLIALGLLPLSAVPALAQDWLVYGGGELELLFDPEGDDSGNTTTLSTYIEAELSGFYFGVSAEVANDSDANEVDPYIGYRGETDGGFSYDAVYTYYVLPNVDDSDYSELTLSFGQTLGDKASVSADLYYYPDDSTKSGYVGVEYYPTDSLTLSANYGVYEVFEASSEQEWDVGVGYSFNEEVAAELRYYDGSEYVDSYVGLSVTFDTTILGG